jgi:mannose-6-phosphate isomerase-like protein (cupin superfamily)
MKMRRQFCLFALSLILTAAGYAQGQEMTQQAAGRNVTAMKLTTIPGLPTCVKGSVENGDPTKGPSIIFAEIPTGCQIPWHWHTPNEHLMIVSGAARVEMKDGAPVTLEAGGFALMPSQHVHQFRCERACQLYIYADAAFDIHYVDAQGNEIAPPDALKAVKETVATEMK